jgi:hypothetical protein
MDDMWPGMDERDKYAELCDRFDSKKVDGVTITLKEASFMKLFCDAYFIRQAQKKHARLAFTEEPHRADDNSPDASANSAD